LLAKLTSLEKRGVRLSKTFTPESSLEDIRGEYNRIKSQRELESSVRFQRKVLMACVTGIEFLNNRFDPFDVDLDGWSETVHEGVDEYDDIFEELYEKYKGRANIAPELRLLFALGGSAMMFHLQKTMFQSAIPGMADVLKQNPEIAKQFASAASGGGQRQSRGGGMGGGGLGGLFGGLGGLGNMVSGLFGGGGMGGGNMPPSEETMENARRAEMEGPGDIDALLREIEQDRDQLNSSRSAAVVNNRNERPTRVSVERSAANTINLDV